MKKSCFTFISSDYVYRHAADFELCSKTSENVPVYLSTEAEYHGTKVIA
ncbi:hypothetical protein V6C42_09430 [Pseudoclostridium thermosuccinogenes]